MSSKGRGSYEMEVFADSADEAIAIAAEALPPEARIIESSAHPTANGPDGNWTVSLKFKSGKKKAKPSVPDA